MNEPRSLFWLYFGSLTNDLSRATYLETSAELAKLGWQVTLFTSAVPAGEVDGGIRLVLLSKPAGPFGYFIYHLSFLRYLVFSKPKPDVILFHQQSAPFLFLTRLIFGISRARRPFLVMDSRDLPVDDSLPNRIWTAIYKLSYFLASRFFDGQTAITAYMASAVHIPESQLLGTWPSGVRSELFNPAFHSRAWPTQGDCLKLIYIGVLHPGRNLVAVCKAVELVNRKGIPVQFTILGEGPQRPALEKIAEEMGKHLIDLRQAVPRGLVPEALSEAHIGMLPFPDTIKLSASSFVKMFEYMAAGMPVIATRIPAHRSVLKVSYTFWAAGADPASLAESIIQAYSQLDRLKYMGGLALKDANQWTWLETAKKLNRLLRTLFNPK